MIRGLRGKLLEPAGTNTTIVCLSFDGWTKYSELKKGRADARKAFMAMPFGELKVDQVFTVFEKACADTDFRLVRLDKHPKAGIIDNRLRVDIEISRFVIADLTNDNKGAYWEGGFAEGLGKPVFCSYEKSFF